jgi:hypothetical protein
LLASSCRKKDHAMRAIPNLPESLAREIYADLCRSLPPPPDDTPGARATRDERAMTAVAHLLPENAAEAEIAVLIVAAQFQARDALRAACQPGLAPEQVRCCRAQAASMMRRADTDIRTLMRMQAERVKAETAMRPAAMERAGYWFKSVTVPHPEPARAPDPPLPIRLEYGAMTPAERYATLYPDRASRILAERGLPTRLTFPPPDPEVVTDLLSSSSPLVRALFEPAQAS